MEIIKQKTWANGVGTFDQNKKTCVKLSLAEIGGILRVLNDKQPLVLNDKGFNENPTQTTSMFHKNAKGTKQIHFTRSKWMSGDKENRFFGITVNVAEGAKSVYRISLNEDEGELLKEYLKFGLERIFLGAAQEKKKKFEDQQKAKKAQNPE